MVCPLFVVDNGRWATVTKAGRKRKFARINNIKRLSDNEHRGLALQRSKIRFFLKSNKVMLKMLSVGGMDEQDVRTEM